MMRGISPSVPPTSPFRAASYATVTASTFSTGYMHVDAIASTVNADAYIFEVTRRGQAHKRKAIRAQCALPLTSNEEVSQSMANVARIIARGIDMGHSVVFTAAMNQKSIDVILTPFRARGFRFMTREAGGFTEVYISVRLVYT